MEVNYFGSLELTRSLVKVNNAIYQYPLILILDGVNERILMANLLFSEIHGKFARKKITIA